MNDTTGKVLRTVGIVFFGLTTAMNLLGGIGTSCAAFLTKQYPPYWALIKEDMQWLYQGLVITTVIIGLAGIWVIIKLIRGKKNAFRNALIVLVIGTILAGIQYYYSLQLFGKAAPANVKFFTNVITLLLFLVFLIPGIKQRVNFSKNEGGADKILLEVWQRSRWEFSCSPHQFGREHPILSKELIGSIYCKLN